MRARLESMDALRALAITTMVCANMAALMGESPPLWFRFYGSFAAPTFISLAGFFVSRSVGSGRTNFIDFLRRAGLLLFTAAVLDMFCYGIMPFVQVDVLYLIGVGTPLAFFVARLPAPQVFAVCVGIFSLSPLLRGWLGYPPELLGLLVNGQTYAAPDGASIAQQWLVSGWFPLFPWLGFLFFGIFLEKVFVRAPDWFTSAQCRKLGLGLAAAGGLGFVISPSPMYIRVGYSEIFYPPATNFIVLAIGVIFLGFWLTSVTEKNRIWALFRPLGRASLFFYALHLVLISYVLKPLFGRLSLSKYLFVYLGLLLLLLGCAQVLAAAKQRFLWMRGFIGRFYFGT